MYRPVPFDASKEIVEYGFRFLCCLFFAAALTAQTSEFSDDFSGTALDLSKWVPHSGRGGVANLEAVEVRDGCLRLVSRREGPGFLPVTVSTVGSFARMYGRFEVRLRAPHGKGLESQVRLLPVASGELPAIDVVTIAGNAGEPARFENRWGDEKTERAYSGVFALPASGGDGFHVITVEWDASRITWSVDGKERLRSVSGIPKQPMYLEVSLGIGGPNARWPDSTTPSPSVLEVDYIRALPPSGVARR